MDLGPDSKRVGLRGGTSAGANSGVPDRLFKRHSWWLSETAKDGYVEDSVSARMSVSKSLNIYTCSLYGPTCFNEILWRAQQAVSQVDEYGVLHGVCVGFWVYAVGSRQSRRLFCHLSSGIRQQICSRKL